MKMSYTVLGTNNMEASIKFYDSLFEQTELNQVLSTERDSRRTIVFILMSASFANVLCFHPSNPRVAFKMYGPCIFKTHIIVLITNI